MAAVDKYRIGSITKAKVLKFFEKDKTTQIPPAGFTVTLAVKSLDDEGHPIGDAIFERSVTTTDADGNPSVYLMDDETNLLTAGKTYVAAVEYENRSLPKPVKDELQWYFKAVAGVID